MLRGGMDNLPSDNKKAVEEERREGRGGGGKRRWKWRKHKKGMSGRIGRKHVNKRERNVMASENAAY